MMGMNPMMGMGMGMGMPGMMPYGPYNPRQIPGFFGRDVLGGLCRLILSGNDTDMRLRARSIGREFSGPGGAGELM